MNKIIPWMVTGGAVLVLALGGYALMVSGKSAQPDIQAPIAISSATSSGEATGTNAVLSIENPSPVPVNTQILTTQSTTTSTYKNMKYGFEFQLFSGWTMALTRPNRISLFRPGRSEEDTHFPCKERCYLGNILIDIHENKKDLSIDEYIKQSEDKYLFDARNGDFGMSSYVSSNGVEIINFKKVYNDFLGEMNSIAFIKGKQKIFKIFTEGVDEHDTGAMFDKLLESFLWTEVTTKIGNNTVLSNPANLSDIYLFESVSNEDTTLSSDFQIIIMNSKTKEKIILVPSVKEAIPALAETPNQTLIFFSTSTDKEHLYFKDVYSESDSGINGIYAYDVPQRLFERLPLILTTFKLSPNGQNIAFVNSEGDDFENTVDTIYVYSLNSRSYIASTTLSKTETVTSWSGYDTPFIEWFSDTLLKYKVYQKKNITDTKSPSEPPFESRSVIVVIK